MKARSLFLMLLPFLLSAGLAAQSSSGEETLNNTLRVSSPANLQFKYTLEFVSGQGAGASIAISLAKSGKVSQELKKAGDSFVLEAGKSWEVFFTPNVGKDGSSYVVKLSDNAANCTQCRDKRDHFMTFKAEKPESTLLSIKSRRKLVLTPNWKAPMAMRPAMSQMHEVQKEELINEACQAGEWSLTDTWF